MGRYILRRLLWMIPVILGVAIFIFTIMYWVPGDPAQLILGENGTPETIAALRENMGLNDPYVIQLGRFLKKTFIDWDFGESYFTRLSVGEELMSRLPRTIALGVSSMVLTLLVGTPLGIMAAVYQNRLPDRICMLIALIGVSMPTFWLALMLVILFSVNLGWLPAQGITGFSSYILPVVSLSFAGWGSQARLSRSAMLEVIRSDYVTTAKAKGLTQREVIFKHALRNALIPIITSAGGQLASVFGGSAVIENVFSIPGVGNYMIQAINNRDYPVVEGAVIFLAIVFAICMLLVDLGYAFVDPRIKAQYAGKSRKKRKVAVNG